MIVAQNYFRGILLICLLLILGSTNLAFAAPIIDIVDIDETTDNIRITINFTMPVSYLKHFPFNNGKQLDINVLPIANSADQQQAVSQEQRLAYRPTKTNPLQIIRFDADNPAGKVLSLLFSADTVYRVANQEDPRRITIILTKKVDQSLADTHKTVTEDKRTRPPEIEDSDNFKYVINLLSSSTAPDQPDYQTYPALKPYYIYPARITIDNVPWERIRLGFFRTKEDAHKKLDEIKADFPRAWIDRAKDEERKHIQPWLFALARGNNELAFAQQATSKKVKTSSKISTKSQQLFADAKKQIIDGNYRRAILLLTKLLNMPENESSEAAQELIGVAREKNRQIAHAIAEYRTYLKRYPKGEYHNRVKQRLEGLTSARRPSRRKLRKAKSRSKETPWQVYGTLFQFYRRDVDTTDPSNNIVTNSSLDTDLSVTARKRSKTLDIRTQFTGSYQYDLERSDQSEFRLSSLYVDAADHKRSWNMRLGRQSQSTGGVLGRFDGVTMGYRLSPKWKLNAVTGFPVTLSTSNQLETDKSFYGLSLDAGTFDKYWNASAFIIKQTAFDIDDRTAVGAELRYLNPQTTVFALLDYDIDYQSLNIAQMIANARLPFDTTINLVADYRNSPILTTSNAIQGQTNSTLEQLLLTFTEDEIRQLAMDRTAVFRSISGTLSRPITKNLLLSLDLAASHLQSTPASGGVDATTSSGIEYFYGGQLIANSVFKTGDTTLVGLRYADTASSDTLTFSINSRYPHDKYWRFNPRLRIDDQKRNDNSTILRLRPSFRVDYRAMRKVKLELELGYEHSDINDNLGGRSESNYFINMGYILDF